MLAAGRAGASEALAASEQAAASRKASPKIHNTIVARQMAAVNEAGRKADEAMQSSMQGMLGGLKLPGLS